MKLLGRQLLAWFLLGRVSNLPTVWTNVMVGWCLARGALEWSASLAWLLLGASLLYSGGTTMNDFADAAFDRTHRPERPIPSGVLSRGAVGVGSLLYFLGGAWAVCGGAGGSLLWCGLLLASIIGYDIRHKGWVGAVVVMGACRFFLILLASSCVDLKIGVPVLVHAAGLLGYIVGLSLTARGESRQATIHGWYSGFLFLPMAGLMAVAGLAGVWTAGVEGPIRIVVAVGCYLLAVIGSLRLLGRRADGERVGKAVSLMLASIALLDAAFLATFGWGHALMGWAGFVLARLLQRVVPAT